MCIGKTFATLGFATGNSNSPMNTGGLSIGTGLLCSYGISQQDSSLKYVPDFDQTIGELSVCPAPNETGIKVELTVDIPDDFRRHLMILRGKYSYKRHIIDEGSAVVYETASFNPTGVIEFIDTDVEEESYYYYSCLMLVGTPETPAHYVFNPNTGFDYSFRTKEYNHAAILYSKLPYEWRTNDTDGFVEKVCSLYGKIFDRLKSEIEVKVRQSKSIYDSNEKNLQALGSLIDWVVNRELDEIAQRTELENAIDVYKAKGRHEAITFLIETLTAWDTEVEEGYRRIGDVGIDLQVMDWDDLQGYSRLNRPWLRITDEIIGTSDGLADQEFVLDFPYTDLEVIRVTIDGEETTWFEVDAFDGLENQFTVTRDNFTTITFGDGINGNIPEDTSSITCSYIHGGDPNKYVSSYPDNWRSNVGSRIILKETAEGVPLSDLILDKIFNIIERFKASYAVYNVLVLPNTSSEDIPVPLDDFDPDTDDVTFEVVWLLSNEEDHQSNKIRYRSVGWPNGF